METRARSLLVGAFTLAVIAAGFIFVYWLNTAGGLGERDTYRIRYQNTVSGLLVGSPVLFNGVRVGEVTALVLNPEKPLEITATIGIEPGTPVSEDTRASIEFPGLMGSAAVSLAGGASTARLVPQAGAARGEYPLLVADPDAGQGISQAARETLRRLDMVIADNAEPLRNTMVNISKFSEALGRNSDKVDGIVAGIERLTGGGVKSAGTLYDLTAAREFPSFEKPQLADLGVTEPTVTFALGQDKIFVRDGGGLTPLADARWSDMLANMFQSRVIQSFENANFLREIGKGGDNQTAFQLAVDIRSFEIVANPRPTAVVEFSAKISGGEGRVIDSHVFRQSVPVAELTPTTAASSLDKAFGAAASELVAWTSAAIKGAS
jgi:phospholipid/cholesterol/gamma-HCH transport system substrate-binding protein